MGIGERPVVSQLTSIGRQVGRFNTNAAPGERPGSYAPKQVFNDAGQVSFEEIAVDLLQARFLFFILFSYVWTWTVAFPTGRKGTAGSGEREVEASSSGKIPPFSGIKMIRALLSTIF